MTSAEQQMQIELQLQDAMDRRCGSLIAAMQKLMDGMNMGNWKEMTPAQMSGLLAVATETECVPVVISFIQYQIGRDKAKQGGPKSWAVNDFGEKLIKDIQSLRKQAENLADEIAKRSDNEMIDRIWIQLTRLYVGHLRRYFVYKKLKEDRQ